MKNQIQLKQSQKLQLSPQLKQSIQLLNMSTLERDEWLADVVADNPLLDMIANAAERMQETQRNVTASTNSMYTQNDDSEPWLYIAQRIDFRHSLLQQICEHPLGQKDAFFVRILIESLDEHGYLSTSLHEIVEDAPLEWRLTEECLAQALTSLQQFDPAGVAAADLSESLVLQLMRLPENHIQQLALEIVGLDLSVLRSINADKQLSRSLRASIEDVQAALHLIGTLNPYPASGFEVAEPTMYVKPDVVVNQNEHGIWEVVNGVFSQLPIEINREYAAIATEAENEAMLGLLKDAQALLQQLQLRNHTILMVTEYIVRHQQAFFEKGRIALKPMSLGEVADALSVHESTISRAVNKKYLSCPLGVFELRSFFTQALLMENDVEVSAALIQSLILECIQTEDKLSPFSDDAICQWLAAKEIVIARRTVAKYREALEIPAAFARKVKAQLS